MNVLPFPKVLDGPFARCTCEINQTDLGNVLRGMPGQAISIDIFLLLSLFPSLSGRSLTLFFPLFNLFSYFLLSLSALSLSVYLFLLASCKCGIGISAFFTSFYCRLKSTSIHPDCLLAFFAVVGKGQCTVQTLFGDTPRLF